MGSTAANIKITIYDFKNSMQISYIKFFKKINFGKYSDRRIIKR